jgi:hypothetical protein
MVSTGDEREIPSDKKAFIRRKVDMRQLFERCFRKLDLWRFRRSVEDALALHHRGEVRNDGLKLDGVYSHLEIRWHAREIHPWDRDLLHGSRKQAAFAEQAFADTEAAILRLFEKLPHVDVIDLSVLEPASEALIAAGTVHRSELSGRRTHLLSVGMRLRDIGVHYNLAAEMRHPGTLVPDGELCTR